MHKYFAVILLLLGTSTVAFAAKPNLVFMIADDCTFRDIGCYGGEIDTPNLDRLRTTAVTFPNGVCLRERRCLAGNIRSRRALSSTGVIRGRSR